MKPAETITESMRQLRDGTVLAKQGLVEVVDIHEEPAAKMLQLLAGIERINTVLHALNMELIRELLADEED